MGYLHSMDAAIEKYRNLIWEEIGKVMDKLPSEVRHDYIQFFLTLAKSHYSGSVKIGTNFLAHVKRVMELLSENPDLRPQFHTRAAEVEKMFEWTGGLQELKFELENTLFRSDTAKMRALALHKNVSFNSIEERITDGLIQAVKDMNDSDEWFGFVIANSHARDVIEDVAYKLTFFRVKDPEMQNEGSKTAIRTAITMAFGKNPFDNKYLLIDVFDKWLNGAQKIMDKRKSEADPEYNRFVDGLENALLPLLALNKLGTSYNADDGRAILDYLYDQTAFRKMPKKHYFFDILIRAFMQKKTLKDLDSGSEPLKILTTIYDVAKKNGETDVVIYEVEQAVEKVIAPLRAAANAPAESLPDDDDPIYGKYLFAPNRERKVPKEPNTDREQAAFDELTKHIFDNQPVDQEVALDLIGVLEKGEYSNLLHEPEGEYVYRGISMNSEKLSEILGVEADEIPQSGSKVINRRMTSLKGEGSSAWSMNLKSAIDFSDTGGSRQYAIVLVARLDENPDSFLEGPGGFYNVPAYKSYAHEKESIALGPIRVYKIYWQYRPYEEAGVYDLDVEEAGKVAEGISLLRGYISEIMRRS